MEMEKSVLYLLGTPLSFWVEAISTTVYVRNRSPTVQLKNVSTYERWYNKKTRRQQLEDIWM